MTTTLFRGALACALLTSTALTAPALAQSPPPVNHNVDENGVDLVLGRFELSQTLVSIGPAWPHGLHYTRIRDGDRWVDNFTGGIHQTFNQIFVSIGNSSAKFIYSGGNSLFTAGTFTPARADGSTLTRSGGVFTFTNSRGEIARFTAEIGTDGRIVLGTGRIMDMRYPNGALVTLNYRTESVCDESAQNCVAHFRIQSVTNNFNYQLHFSYAENGPVAEAEPGEWQQLTSVRAINTAVESCDPDADQCALTGAWPTASLGSASGYETVTLPDSNVWRYDAGTSGLTAIRRPGSTSDDVTISYGSPPDTISVTGAAGTWTYAFSDSGTTRTTIVAGPLGTGRTITSDIDRQIVLADENALGQTTSYQYDSNDRITRITAPEGNYTAFTYDGRGNVTEQRTVAKSGSGLSDIVATATYPSSCTNQMTCNQPSAVTDALGNTTDFTYDSTHGGAVTVTGPAPATGAVRPQARIGYTSASVGGETVRLPTSVSQCQTQSSCSAAADEAVGSVSYSGANFLPTGISRGNGSGTLTATSAIAYDDIGNVLTVDGPLSGSADTIRFRYNAARQPVGVVGPDPDGGGGLKHRAQRTTYDGAGLPIVTEVGTVNSQSDSDWTAMTVLEAVATERDTFGRPIVQRLVSGSTTFGLTQASYDAAGRVRCIAQRMNDSEFAPSSLPSDVCAVDSEGSYGKDRITRTSYDAAGRVNLVETGVATGDAASEVATTYSNNGRVATVTDAEGNRTTYEYDGFDRLRNTRFPSPTTDGVSAPTSGTGADYEQFGYDPAGNLVSRRVRSGGTIAFGYDALNRMILKDVPGNDPAEFDVTYAYDNLGRMLSATGATGHVIGYGYDALGRAISESGPFGANAMQYDLAGRPTRLTWPDAFYVDYAYNDAGDLTHIRENGATSGAGVLATFVYDDRGRRTSLTRGNGLVTGYSYDAVSRLTELTHDLAGTSSDLTLGFGHNPAGQIASNTRSNDAFSFTGHANLNRADTVNGLNQVTATGATSVGYDARGNIQTIGSNYYEYSIENRLAWAWDPDPTGFAYDPLGRIHQTAYPTTTRYAYAGAQLISELDNANALQRRYVFGPGIDEPLVWYEGSGTSDRRWLHADERGSVIAVSDGNGDLVGTRNRYDEYGVPQGTLTGRFGYTGQAWLPEIGMYDYRNRIYNPALGRFMQTDPIGYGGGMNLYAYVANDPVNLIDPLGLQGDDECRPPNCGTVFGSGPFKGGPGLGGIGGNSSSGPAGQRMVSTNAPVEEIVVTGTRTLRGVLEDILNGAITEQGRDVRVTDLGITEGGVITIHGRIWRWRDNLMIFIDYIEAYGHGRAVVQSIDAAIATARRLGLKNLVIGGYVVNRNLAALLQVLAHGPNDRVVSLNGVTSIIIDVATRPSRRGR